MIEAALAPGRRRFLFGVAAMERIVLCHPMLDFAFQRCFLPDGACILPGMDG